MQLPERHCCSSLLAFITPGMPSPTTSLFRDENNKRPSGVAEGPQIESSQDAGSHSCPRGSHSIVNGLLARR